MCLFKPCRNSLVNFGCQQWLPVDGNSWRKLHQNVIFLVIHLFWYVSLPTGLPNAQETFKSGMYVIFSPIQWKRLLVYLNDFVHFSKSVEEHIKVDYLWYTIQPGCQEKASYRQRHYRPERPENRGKDEIYPRFCNVYRRIVPKFAHIIAPLNEKVRKGNH